jgi:glycosyltransferase involved in cell wall biosynthesis
MDQEEGTINAGFGLRSGSFPTLQADASVPHLLARVCIVTPEILGPTRNGGVGTAYTSLALVLAKAGHEVTVLFTGARIESGTLSGWESYFASKGIILIALQHSNRRKAGKPYYGENSYEVFSWLRDNHSKFDIVHFGEWQGLGYYSLLAKHQGITFRDITFCIGTHSSTSWLEAGRNRGFCNLEHVAADFMERESVRLADVILSPSQYLLKWMTDDGWKLPDAVFVSPYTVPNPSSFLATNRPVEKNTGRATIREIVFFGRLEIRKGLIVFCDAIDRLLRHNSAIVPRITFLGKPVFMNGEDTDVYIRRRAQRWDLEVSICSKDHEDAMDYIGGDGVLAVMPSVIENFPNTVLECLMRRIPFLASAVGGIPEQIAESDRERVLFRPRPDALAAKIEHALQQPPTPATPAFDFVENNTTVVRWHEALASAAQRNRERGCEVTTDDARPLVSVCLVHHDRPVYLKQALESLRKQDYSPFEVILVDDGSKAPEALAYLERLEPEFRERGWQIVLGENRYVGAARNAAARRSRGEYLLFMDDDNYACADELSVAVAVAQRTNADILTFMEYYWEGNQPPAAKAGADSGYWVPLGPCLSAGMYENVFGDANALVKRSVFEQLGGFKEVYGVTCEDWELWARAVHRGFRLEVIPLPLFWYRLHPTSMLETSDRLANALLATSPYREKVSRDLRPAFAFAVDRWISGRAISEVKPSIQNELNALWDSLSWRAFRPARNLAHRIKGLPKEARPVPRTDQEGLNEIIALRQSLSWELTMPLRFGHRLLGGRRRTKSPPRQP